ncbi:ribokinase [Flaviflexus salsibiostraticola]|uniref:Ribokinase n=1 Tax=Flaviflexus salsibiostraticola TaxID=1282737 RepID=A0A3S8Z6V5_9ACTO|nr:ribokinase [Flaviflexus salsibiostraticola]AZN29241.1 ribokinase [Flaviflexus salsibiostraticola]
MILVIGSYGTGITMRVPRIPESGETISGAQLSIGYGGKSSNQAVAARRQGASRVELITAIGDDAFGREARQLWNDEGIGFQFVKTVPEVSTMVGGIFVEPSGENRIVIAPGALEHLTVKDLESFSELFDQASVVVVCLEIPTDVVAHAIAMADERGARVVLNPAPAAPLDESVFSKADFFIPNESEFEFYSKSGYERPPGQTLIVTQGSGGVRVIDDAGEQRFAPLPQEKVVDTTGAGDTFVGTFCAAIDEGLNVSTAVKRAIVASSLSVTKNEVIPAIPEREAVDAELKNAEEGIWK